MNYKVIDKELVVVDSLEIKDAKTKAMAKLMDDLKLKGKVLFVTSEVRENLYLGIRNLGYADVVMAEDLSILDIVNSDTIVFEESAIKYIEEAFN